MKYRANIKNDNKNMKSICKITVLEWIRTMQNIQFESKWVKSNDREVWKAMNVKKKKSHNDPFCRLIILLMHRIVCTIDDVQ